MPDTWIPGLGGEVTHACAHKQAVGVHTVDGQYVADMCVSCFKQLPTGYVSRQRAHAERAAYCDHWWVELAELGVEPANWEGVCSECGTLRSDA